MGRKAGRVGATKKKPTYLLCPGTTQELRHQMLLKMKRRADMKSFHVQIIPRAKHSCSLEKECKIRRHIW